MTSRVEVYDKYKLTLRSAKIFDKYYSGLSVNRSDNHTACSIELIERWMSKMDAETKARAEKTIKFLRERRWR